MIWFVTHNCSCEIAFDTVDRRPNRSARRKAFDDGEPRRWTELPLCIGDRLTGAAPAQRSRENAEEEKGFHEEIAVGKNKASEVQC